MAVNSAARPSGRSNVSVMVPSAATVTSAECSHASVPSSLTATCTVSPACQSEPVSVTVSPGAYVSSSLSRVGVPAGADTAPNVAVALLLAGSVAVAVNSATRPSGRSKVSVMVPSAATVTSAEWSDASLPSSSTATCTVSPACQSDPVRVTVAPGVYVSSSLSTLGVPAGGGGVGAVTVKLALALPDVAVAVTANVPANSGQVEGVGDGAVGGRDDVGLMGPGVALVVVDDYVDGFVRCPAGPRTGRRCCRVRDPTGRSRWRADLRPRRRLPQPDRPRRVILRRTRSRAAVGDADAQLFDLNSSPQTPWL